MLRGMFSQRGERALAFLEAGVFGPNGTSLASDAFGRGFYLNCVRPSMALPGNGGTLCGKHIDKLASDVGHAGHFRGVTFTEHAVETGIAIRMHPALITRQVLDRVLTLSIHCELIPNAGRCPSSTAGQIVCLCACGARAGPWSFVSDIGPDAGCPGLFVSWGQHLQWGIICKQGCAIFGPFCNGLGQWFQKPGRFAHPICHSRAIQIDTLTGIDCVPSCRQNRRCS